MQLTAEAEVACPYCGETFPLMVDTSQATQSLVEDCTVCCRPIQLTIVSEPGQVLEVHEDI